MKALEFIKLKQKVWAEKYIKKQNENNENKTHLVSGTLINGKEANNSQEYFEEIKYNLFPIKDDKDINEYGLREINNVAYSKGSGNEIIDKIEKKEENKTITTRAKMKAVFSSSAIVVNLFQYWQKKEDITPLLKALGFEFKREIEEIIFESKNQITGMRGFPPHLDVIITTNANNFAIESKFTEPYTEKRDKNSKERGKNSEIQHSYIADKKKTLWENSPNLENLAQAIHSPNALIENEEIKEEIKELIKKLRKTNHLDASQLIKHILGLRTVNEKISKDKKITLLYLWYDVPGTEEAVEHQEEIEAFASIAKADGINFRHITYQEVIFNLKENYYDEHKDYIDYLVERYL